MLTTNLPGSAGSILRMNCATLLLMSLCGCSFSSEHIFWGPDPEDISVDDGRAYVTVEEGYRTKHPSHHTTTDEYLFTYDLTGHGDWADLKSIRKTAISDKSFQYKLMPMDRPDERALDELVHMRHAALPAGYFPLLSKREGDVTRVLVGEYVKYGNHWMMLDSNAGEHRVALKNQCRVCRWDVADHRVIFYGGRTAFGASGVSHFSHPLAQPKDTSIFAIWDYQNDVLVEKGFDIVGDHEEFAKTRQAKGLEKGDALKRGTESF